MKRYGKSSEGLFSIKQDFFKNNDELLAKSLAEAAIYTRQPRRTRCKLCDAVMSPEPDFTKHTVPYAFCGQCGHLNGLHEDTDEFCAAIYTQGGGAEYGKNYSSQDVEAYNTRVKTIYLPKAEFLKDALHHHGIDAAALSYVDMGAGSGYFVAAQQRAGLENTIGYEVSKTQVALANQMIPGERVHAIPFDSTLERLANVQADVVSLIGVLEHLQAPRQVLATLAANPSVRFLYLSVPLFSPSVFVEMAFPQAMPRHLAGGHTHLFTASSLSWLAQEYRFEVIGEWWFGTDIVDLFRSMLFTLERNPDTAAMGVNWTDTIKPMIDALQLSLDQRHLSSEVHMLLRIQPD